MDLTLLTTASLTTASLTTASLTTASFTTRPPDTTGPDPLGRGGAEQMDGTATVPAKVPAVGRGRTDSLAGRLNVEWAVLAGAPASLAAAAAWATARPVLAGAHSPEQLRTRIARADAETRDAVLLALLELAQGGDVLAGRTVLQAMLGKAVRVATSVAGRADLRGDREEALACAVAALWQVIATYPVTVRRSRVAANLAMDTVAVVARGHTGSSYFRRTFPEIPVPDVTVVGQRNHRRPAEYASVGPVDAELFVVLAWAVRHRALTLAEARLMARVYAVQDDGRPVDVRVVAEQEGISWPTLRQRCHRLTRRLRAALVDAEITDVVSCQITSRTAA